MANKSLISDTARAVVSTPNAGRAIIGLTGILITYYMADQKNPQLARLYLTVIILGMLLVYADEYSSLVNALFSVNLSGAFPNATAPANKKEG